MNNPVELRKRNDVIVVDDVHMIYRVGRRGVPALSGVDMTVREGEFVAVMGPSGCGKSTLLHLMGMDHKRLTFKFQGRDYRLTDVHGEVLHDLIA